MCRLDILMSDFVLSSMVNVLKFCTPKFLAYADIIDPNQTVPEGAV